MLSDFCTNAHNCFPLLINSTPVTIYVAQDGNIPPVANDDSESTNEDTPVNINVLINDSDPDSGTLTNIGVVIGRGPSSGTVILNGDGETFDYTPNANFHGQDSFVYGISDGNGGTDTSTGAYYCMDELLLFNGS